jgi:hypothetical protein
VVSIDSADPKTHEEMRGLKGVIKGIEIALPILHKHGIYPVANLGINRNIAGLGKISPKITDNTELYQRFREAFESFYNFIIDLGFTMTNACYPMSVKENENTELNAVYGASSQNEVVSFNSEEKIQIYEALMNSEDSLPCRGGIDFFFMDAVSGNTYPCGYKGNENLGKFYDIDINKINNKPFCKACDWECFRDPSEMIGFFAKTIKSPLSTINSKDPVYRQLWKQDLKYYRRCDYFDGRKEYCH